MRSTSKQQPVAPGPMIAASVSEMKIAILYHNMCSYTQCKLGGFCRSGYSQTSLWYRVMLLNLIGNETLAGQGKCFDSGAYLRFADVDM